MTPRKSSKTDPQILEMPPQKMAVVYAKGAPDKVFPEFMPALYGSVYTLKFDLKKKGLPTFKVNGLRARYPDAHLVLWRNGLTLSACLSPRIPPPCPRK
ncbi:hypothetical protein ACFLUD_04400 [Chloroflexota bacterium]